jgi:hypothetical protein
MHSLSMELMPSLICPWDSDQGAELWRGILDGDADAAERAMCLAPNDNRGTLVREGFGANVPNPAFPTLVSISRGWATPLMAFS